MLEQVVAHLMMARRGVLLAFWLALCGHQPCHTQTVPALTACCVPSIPAPVYGCSPFLYLSLSLSECVRARARVCCSYLSVAVKRPSTSSG